MPVDAAGPRKYQLVLVDVVPRFESRARPGIRDSCSVTCTASTSLEEAAAAVANTRRTRETRSPEGLKKNLRHRDGRWHWHWDPAFLTKPRDDPFERVDKMENAAMRLQIPFC